MSILRNKATA